MASYYMLNKPMGYITARSDPRHKTVMDLFPEEMRDKLFPVGRLDKDTEGLLLVTDDGALNHDLLTPESHIDKTYRFYAIGEISEERFSHLTLGAEVFPGKDYVTAPARVRIFGKCRISEIRELLPPRFSSMAQKKPLREVSFGEVIITEGKKHQVKRMVAYSGGEVVYLMRAAIGGLKLDPSLKKGSYRQLTEEEVKILKNRTENA